MVEYRIGKSNPPHPADLLSQSLGPVCYQCAARDGRSPDPECGYCHGEGRVEPYEKWLADMEPEA